MHCLQAVYYLISGPYEMKQRRWGEFCHTQEIHPIITINNAVEFLSYLYDNGVWFAVIATARSTLGNFIHVPGINCPGQ